MMREITDACFKHNVGLPCFISFFTQGVDGTEIFHVTHTHTDTHTHTHTHTHTNNFQNVEMEGREMHARAHTHTHTHQTTMMQYYYKDVPSTCSDDVIHVHKIPGISIVHSRSVNPQKNRRNYLITRSILKFPALRRSSLQHLPFDIYIYISAVGSKNKKLAALYHKCNMAYCTYVILRLRTTSGGNECK